ncbi:MAG: DUF3243 family protein [Clostridia bacterium]|nr:DUF3243 family protein [Clostridia bacterium]
MYKRYETNRKIKETRQWKENLEQVMGHGELVDFFESHAHYSTGEEQMLKSLFDYATFEEKRVLSNLLKKMIRKDRH